MFGNFIRSKFITRFTLVALLVIWLVLKLPAQATPTRTTGAQSCERLILFQGGIPTIGFVPGEILRVTVSDPKAQRPPGVRNELARAQVKLYDQKGNEIAQSPEFTIPQDGFHSVDFSRESIQLEGDAGTRRLQVHPTIILQRLANPSLPSTPFGPARTGGANSIELLDGDGRSKIWIDLSLPVRVSPDAR